MENEFNLNADETIVDRISKIGYGGFWSGNNELVLTNQSIILVKKGFFGNTEEVVKYPLSDLRVVNGQVQAKIGRPDNVTYALDLYFNKGTESFRFEWESDVQKWIDEITEIITGVKVERDEFAWVGETLAMAESVNSTIKSFKKTLGIKSTEQVSIKCPSCGATLTGTEGETVKCPYCGTFTTL